MDGGARVDAMEQSTEHRAQSTEHVLAADLAHALARWALAGSLYFSPPFIFL